MRNQLDRAAPSVSNNIAEGFERITTAEQLQFLGIARGSAGAVRSMMAVVATRPALRGAAADFARIRALAESCSRQLTAWSESIEGSPIQGKRHQTPQVKQHREVAAKAESYRLSFLRNLKPEHPLYGSTEARAARGETA